MLTVFRAVRCSCSPGQAVASVGTGSVEESSQRAAYGSPEKNTTMRARPCNVRSLWVNKAVTACTVSVNGSVFRSVSGTRCAATINGLTHHSSGLPTAAAEFIR